MAGGNGIMPALTLTLNGLSAGGHRAHRTARFMFRSRFQQRGTFTILGNFHNYFENSSDD
jgi:hypothetical protein